ncbi:MAG: arabinose isomerase [Oscillospiraceae bacterium]|jgi:L-arabinose isomerase|nr:arabinose isomerase [Oscillospiraceae bacterium]
MEQRKPKLALLGLMTGGYEAVFPGITERQTRYAQELAQTISQVADVSFEGIGLDRPTIESLVKRYNGQGVDGMVIVLLAYSQGAYLIRALQDNRLPLALAVVQPDQEVLDDWTELDLTVNQGIHGAQDNASVIAKSGVACQFFAGNRHEKRFVDFLDDFARACRARSTLKSMRTAVFSRMCGMGDILTDEFAFHRIVGPEVCHDTIGAIVSRMQQVTQAQIAQQIALDKRLHEVDVNLSRAAHAEAVRMYVAFKGYLREKGCGAFTAHFDQFADDGRFAQLPLYAASNLLAEGYGYAAEGDYMCASMVAAAGALGDYDANFTEMYTMDFAKQAIIFCHAGEGNWATCRKDGKARLIDRYLGEGGLNNPPTHVFTPQPGPATLTSLAYAGEGKFRMVAALGDILEKADLKGCEMPYFFWRPRAGVTPCVEAWLRHGGTHHEVISLGDLRIRWRMLCAMLGIAYEEV